MEPPQCLTMSLMSSHNINLTPLCLSTDNVHVHKGANHFSEIQCLDRSASWLGSWFELCAFTCIANAIPILHEQDLHCEVFTAQSTLIDPSMASVRFPKCARMNHVPKELCVHMSSESGFLANHDLKHLFFLVSKFSAWFERALRSFKG